MDEDSLYFVFEHCRHGTLTDLIKTKEKLSDELCKVYAAEIISALEFCHNKMILHRDLKPENILIGEDLHIRLIDFGDCKEFENSIYDVTRNYIEDKLAKSGLDDNDFD
jgi:serine/threonine protein kinase